MAYIDQPTGARRTTAIGGVVVIHAAIGLVLVTGLATNFVPKLEDLPFEGVEVKLDPPPPPPDVETPPEPAEPTETLVYTPTPVIELPTPRPPVETTRELPVPRPPLPSPTGRIVEAPQLPPPPPPPAPPAPRFSPVAASPANNPGAWVVTADYKTSWIRRELEGTAAFRVTVGRNGRVESCTVTGSTGHGVLDQATCELVTKRARFTPAKDDTGATVAGTYSSAVRWQIPE